MNKYVSRKFIAFAAAFFASLGTGLASIYTGNEIMGVVAIVCVALSAGFYQMAESYVDGKSISSKTTSVNATVNTTTANANVLNDIINK